MTKHYEGVFDKSYKLHIQIWLHFLLTKKNEFRSKYEAFTVYQTHPKIVSTSSPAFKTSQGPCGALNQT